MKNESVLSILAEEDPWLKVRNCDDSVEPIRFDTIESSKLSADLLGISSLSAEIDDRLREGYDLR